MGQDISAANIQTTAQAAAVVRNIAEVSAKVADLLENSGDAKKTRRTRKKKDPDAPKRPMSSFFLWMESQRPKYAAMDPPVKGRELAKLLGPVWGKMDDRSRAPWVKKANGLKEDYHVAVAEYNEGKNKDAGASSSNAGSKRKAPAASSDAEEEPKRKKNKKKKDKKKKKNKRKDK